jgi:hypothetical protein
MRMARRLPLVFKANARAELPAMTEVRTITPAPSKGPKKGSAKKEPIAEPIRFEK